MNTFLTQAFFVFALFSSLFSVDRFLTDPMLQMPGINSIHVVWFTEFPGDENYVEYGEGLASRAVAKTTRLSRMREDLPGEQACVALAIYRHEAILENLAEGEKTPYRAVSVLPEKAIINSSTFFCSPLPKKGSALKILFTSDHQGKPMVAANLQKVREAFPDIDAVFFAGDFVDHADKGSEWFGENGFFACLQGQAHKELHASVYQGGAILQNAPIYCAMGNHERMGRWSLDKDLDQQIGCALPRHVVEKEAKDQSFNSDSYEELFTLPESASGGKKYYAVSFGDVRLVVMDAARIWRWPSWGIKGKYTEDPMHYAQPESWGWGDFIYEPIQKGSAQYQWLKEELESCEYQRAKYRIVMMHHPLHTLGDNIVPPFTDPIQKIVTDAEGQIQEISYFYPKEEDFLIRDIEPLFEQYGVDLVLCGHTHVWNRFQSASGIHYLETSNVGNSYGAYLKKSRRVLPGNMGDNNYIASGDPNGLEPIVPTLAPLKDAEGKPLPYLSSNEITAFSVLSTDTGAVDSYYFDTRDPQSAIVHFDRFYVREEKCAHELAHSIKEVQEYAQKTCLPDLVVFDIDNTLIESARQIALDPSTNGFLRRQFPENSEEVIQAIQAQVPWKLCEASAAEVVQFFQDREVKVIGVTKRSAEIRKSVWDQLLSNGIDLKRTAFSAKLDCEFDGGYYFNGVLHARWDKGRALQELLKNVDWDWQNRLIYFVDDRKSHLEDYHKAFTSKIHMCAFEYTYSHQQQVDEAVLNLQLQDFLADKPIQEDSFYVN